jgi:hypothetical protein
MWVTNLKVHKIEGLANMLRKPPFARTTLVTFKWPPGAVIVAAENFVQNCLRKGERLCMQF